MSKMLLTTTSPFQKKLLQTAKGRRRPLCKALLVGEGALAKRARVRGCLHRRARGENPSSVADCVRATFSHKGRREESEQLRSSQ